MTQIKPMTWSPSKKDEVPKEAAQDDVTGMDADDEKLMTDFQRSMNEEINERNNEDNYCKAPFEIVEGGKKVPPILQTKDKIFEADKYVQNMDEAYRKIKLALEKTQSKQKKAADRHCRELVFSLGDWVLLRFEKARLRKMKGKERLFPKLGMRYYGPFQICDKISDVAYRLKLPEGWKIHNAFHVSRLRPFVGDVPEDMVPEEQPEVEELDEILVPEQILAHKDRKVRGKVARRYLVKFKNYSPMDAKWMEEAELVDSPQLLQLYLEAFQLQSTVT
ncbi:hypothetical protein L7F22_048795 [Adiantum nelumboides]|nr:hypothetical protein [Adiantum nelumboides]